jgi:RHS repeat-associated protein
MKVGTTSYSVVTDALGSVRALVRRDDGAWVGRLRYDPYGQLLDSAGPQPALRYRWTGREYDAETGFYFHRSRYYDPAVGRFVQEDRAGYSGGGNLYAYVNGNVLQARDPEGLRSDYPAYTWAGLCIGNFCFGQVGDRGPGGGTAAGQRIAALMGWAARSEWALFLWANYKEYRAAFEAEQARVLATTDMSDYWRAMRMVYDGATDIGRTAYTTLVMGFIGFPISGDLVALGRQISARFAQGAAFVNDKFIDYMNSNRTSGPATFGWTNSSFTVLSSEAVATDIMWAMVHEIQHLDPQYQVTGMNDPDLYSIEGQINNRTGALLGRAAPYPGFPR